MGWFARRQARRKRRGRNVPQEATFDVNNKTGKSSAKYCECFSEMFVDSGNYNITAISVVDNLKSATSDFQRVTEFP